MRDSGEYEALMAQERAKKRKEQEARQEREDRQRPFSQPEAEADFAYWGKAAFWHPDEAVALLLGKNPDIVNFNNVHSLRNVSPFAREYEKNFNLVTRAVISHQLPERIPPSLFLAWADQMGVQYPAKLRKAVPTSEGPVADRGTPDDEGQAEITDPNMPIADPATTREGSEKPLGKRERDTVLKLIISMAVKGYSYDPKAKKSPITKEIADDVSELGLSVDEDTVRKWLQEAKKVLPNDDALPKS